LKRLAALVLVVLAGCGTPSADLFAIERSGKLPDARITIVVSDDGSIDCDSREAKKGISDADLLDARQLAKDLAPLMDKNLRLPEPSNALLSFRVISDEGEVHFADASPGKPKEFSQLLLLTRKVAMESCGLDR
jgi:hypothetical protein